MLLILTKYRKPTHERPATVSAWIPSRGMRAEGVTHADAARAVLDKLNEAAQPGFPRWELVTGARTIDSCVTVQAMAYNRNGEAFLATARGERVVRG